VSYVQRGASRGWSRLVTGWLAGQGRNCCDHRLPPGRGGAALADRGSAAHTRSALLPHGVLHGPLYQFGIPDAMVPGWSIGTALHHRKQLLVWRWAGQRDGPLYLRKEGERADGADQGRGVGAELGEFHVLPSIVCLSLEMVTRRPGLVAQGIRMRGKRLRSRSPVQG
jgi:hypothetical protein